MTSKVGISDAVLPKVGLIAAESDLPLTSEVSSSELASRFLEEQRHDCYSWQLIVFFSGHPYIRFNRLAVIHALNYDNGRRHIIKALDELVVHGVIRVSTEGNLPLYSLAEDMRRLVQKLTRPAKK